MSKNRLPLLFVGLGFIASGLGFFKASNQQVNEAKAEDLKVTLNGNTISFGSYPSMICYQAMMDTLESEATLVGPNKYEYQGEYYSTVTGKPYTGGILLPGNIYGSQIFNVKCWFKWEPIKWYVVSEETSFTYFYSLEVLDVSRWQTDNTQNPMNDWETSQIRQFLNNEFFDSAFSNEEKNIIYEFTSNKNTSHKNITDKVSLLDKTGFVKHSNYLNATATGYAVAKSVKCDLTGELTSAHYYLNSTENTSDTTKVDFVKGKSVDGSYTVNETTADCEIGVRPLIAINNPNIIKPTTGGGGGGSSVNVPLIIGIIFSVLGMAGVIAFFMLWHKGKMFKVGKTSAPIWRWATISVCITITIVGVCCLFAGSAGVGAGYSATSPVGYWSTTEFTLDTSDPTFGNRYYLGLTKDHKVYRYISNNFEGSVTNPTLAPVEGVGSWSLKNKKLIITASDSWTLFSWETAVTEYHATNNNGFAFGGRILNSGDTNQSSYQVQGYRWYHFGVVNPTGEPVAYRKIAKESW